MIRTFRHKALKRFFEHDDARGLNARHLRKIRQILFLMENAASMADMNYAPFRLHSLAGNLKGLWAVTVTANWRIIFRFDGGDFFDVDLVDYH